MANCSTDFEKEARILEDGCTIASTSSPTAVSPTTTLFNQESTKGSMDATTIASADRLNVVRRPGFWSRMFRSHQAPSHDISTSPTEHIVAGGLNSNAADAECIEHEGLGTPEVQSLHEGLGTPEYAMSESDSVQRSREPRVRSLQKFPRGYPHLAAFADSDESYMLYRRFGYLQSRILLDKQDELRCLEEQLDELDANEMYLQADKLFRRASQGEQRKALLDDIERKFCQYARVMGAAQKLMSANRPTASEHKSVLNFIADNPVAEKEAEYAYWKEDLITLRPGRENAWLDRGIEKVLKLLHCNALEYIFGSRVSRMKSSDPHHVYYCKERIDTCAVTLITMMILFLLVVPIYFLYTLVKNSEGKMTGRANAISIGILLMFTLVFSAVMSFFTRARRHDILGAAAAYCAVLVVFIGNVGNNS